MNPPDNDRCRPGEGGTKSTLAGAVVKANDTTAINYGSPCSCGAPATRTLGTTNFCEPCIDEFLDEIRARRLASGVGYGAQVGPMRPDFGSGWADLSCSSCSAGWVGIIGERCQWCERRIKDLKAAQVRLDERRRWVAAA